MKFNLDFKATWIFHRWIIFTMSHSWVLNIIIFSSLNIIILSGHLERFSWKILLNASLVAPSGCGLFVWIIHEFASSHMICVNFATSSEIQVFAHASMLHGFIRQDGYQFCIFLWRSCGVPRFVLLSSACLCKWEKYDSRSLNLHENHSLFSSISGVQETMIFMEMDWDWWI